MQRLTVSEARRLFTQLEGKLETMPGEKVIRVSQWRHASLAILQWKEYKSIIETSNILTNSESRTAVLAGLRQIENGKKKRWQEMEEKEVYLSNQARTKIELIPNCATEFTKLIYGLLYGSYSHSTLLKGELEGCYSVILERGALIYGARYRVIYRVDATGNALTVISITEAERSWIQGFADD